MCAISSTEDRADENHSRYRRWRHPVALACLATVSAALDAAVALARYHTFRASTFDLVIFDQAVRSYSHFRAPVALVKGVHAGYGPGFSVLGDHFSPILALLAPLYWVRDDPRTLLVAQAVLFAAAIVPLWVLTRRELSTGAAYCVAGAYALSWPIAAAMAFDFHEVAFAPLITAVAFERLSAYRHGTGRWWHPPLALLALLAVKEDTGLLVAGLGVAVALSARRFPAPRRALLLGAGCVLGGLLALVVTSGLLIPAFGGRSRFYASYPALGSTPGSALWHLVAHPLDTMRLLISPGVKARTLLALIVLPVLAPLASPYLLAAVPLVAERLLSGMPTWWGTDYHYNAYLVVPLLCAGVDGAARLSRRSVSAGRLAVHPGTVWAAVALAVAIASVPSFAFGTLTDPATWRADPGLSRVLAATRQIPNGALVEAVSPIGPRLSGRTRVLLWDRVPRWAPWVVADVGRGDFPFCTLDEQRQRVAMLESNGYRTVYSGDGYLLLHKPDAVPELTGRYPAPCTGP